MTEFGAVGFSALGGGIPSVIKGLGFRVAGIGPSGVLLFGGVA